MAITSSAKKALRASARKRVFNLRHKKAMEDAVKAVKKLLLANKVSEAKAKLSSAYKEIDKSAKTNFINKNNASRQKSRLAKLVNRAK